ncbi:MAG: urea ABC transporter permease subunit UrtB, partial [Alphaproteobacteria bacterium]|nr:urea ABC transporter permease subunit UrtB [Alphaproteobacteria bacterium]
MRVLLLSGLTLLAIAVAPLARADEFATLLSDLAGGSFADKEKAVIALGRLGDGRAVAVLTALKDGRLIKAPDGRILVS